MDTIKVGKQTLKIAINDDPSRVIEFNPNDILFVEKFYGLMRDFESKEHEYLERAEELDANQTMDKTGVPVNLIERLEYLREVCEFVHASIDRVFGEGTSQKIFQGQLDLSMIAEFFEGITPLIQKVRTEKISKHIYQTAKPQKRVLR